MLSLMCVVSSWIYKSGLTMLAGCKFLFKFARLHWNSSDYFRRRHTACFYWWKKICEGHSIFNSSLLSSIPVLWLRDFSWNATSALFFSDSWNYSGITAVCNKSLQYWKLSSNCSWDQGFLKIPGSCDIGPADAVIHGCQGFYVVFT